MHVKVWSTHKAYQVSITKVSVDFSRRYQDIHNKSYIMVIACGRWLGVRMEVIMSLLIGTVALSAVLVSQDAGKYIIITLITQFYEL